MMKIPVLFLVVLFAVPLAGARAEPPALCAALDEALAHAASRFDALRGKETSRMEAWGDSPEVVWYDSPLVPAGAALSEVTQKSDGKAAWSAQYRFSEYGDPDVERGLEVARGLIAELAACELVRSIQPMERREPKPSGMQGMWLLPERQLVLRVFILHPLVHVSLSNDYANRVDTPDLVPIEEFAPFEQPFASVPVPPPAEPPASDPEPPLWSVPPPGGQMTADESGWRVFEQQTGYRLATKTMYEGRIHLSTEEVNLPQLNTNDMGMTVELLIVTEDPAVSEICVRWGAEGTAVRYVYDEYGVQQAVYEGWSHWEDQPTCLQTLTFHHPGEGGDYRFVLVSELLSELGGYTMEKLQFKISTPRGSNLRAGALIRTQP